jgi:hypothetical protein
VTFQAIAAPHWKQTKTTPGESLPILEDATEIDYGRKRKIDDLSPVGSGNSRGFHVHSGLMISAEDDRIHGLAGQRIYHRQHIPKAETRTERLRRDDRESQIWCKLVDQIGSPPPGTTSVHVVDRGAVDFEFFYHCQQTRTEWVLYTPLRVESLDEAMVVTGYYEKRWLIEEWHKALKTGRRVQKRQLKTGERLEPMVGLIFGRGAAPPVKGGGTDSPGASGGGGAPVQVC